MEFMVLVFENPWLFIALLFVIALCLMAIVSVVSGSLARVILALRVPKTAVTIDAINDILAEISKVEVDENSSMR